MLESLTIRNFAIIDEMTVEFHDGLSVITGETGAGKSIVIDALELVLGARGSTDLIRAGESELEVSAVFTDIDDRLFEHLPFDNEEGILILRRQMREDGVGRCYANDRPVTVRTLKTIGDRLVDLHGQHDHQSLFSVPEHIHFLDEFASLDVQAEKVRHLHNELAGLSNEIVELKRRVEQGEREHELNLFQMQEIDKAELVPGEDDALEADIQRLSHASELKEFGYQAFHMLSEAEGSIGETAGNIAGQLEDLSASDHTLRTPLDMMSQILDQVQELSSFFRHYADSIDDDPSALAECEDRLKVIERVKNKYGPTIENVLSFRNRLESASNEVTDVMARIEELESRIGSLRGELIREARSLSIKRVQAAPDLSREVETHLAELGMAHARLVVDVSPVKTGLTVDDEGTTVTIGANGMNRVEFMFSANPGEEPKSLSKIASGGEISRVMLSLKLALTTAVHVPTMVFDEIDTGVSGRVAEAVGNKILALAGIRQVLVITHLPQIAGKAHCHFSARKKVSGDRTIASLVRLDDEMRQEELAAMLSGDILTDAARAQARQLMRDDNDRN